MSFVELSTVKNKAFDYVIVGGGTAGLLIASRLTEDPATSVLVLDAGKPNLNDPLIERPGLFGQTFMKPDYDWAFMTAPQPFANNRPLFWPRGKSLGGSSAMNFSVWSTPPKGDIDDWERLGNPGWNWEAYQKVTEEIATYAPNDEDMMTKYSEAIQAPWKESFGRGPLKLSQPKRVLPVQALMQETFSNSGLPIAPEPARGAPNGSYVAPVTLDSESRTRSYATTAFLLPHVDRPNYKVLTGAYVNRLKTANSGGVTKAVSVEFSIEGEEGIQEVNIAKEVILCAGAIKSPQILELSGIGKPEILNRAGIPVKVALEGVGENVQEHYHIDLSFQLKDDADDDTIDILRDPEQAAKHLALFEKGEGVFMIFTTTFAYLPLSKVSSRATNLLQTLRNKVDSEKPNYPPGLQDQYSLMLEKIAQDACGFELVMFPGHVTMPKQPEAGKKYVTLAAATNYNFSRGTVHIKSKDPMEAPLIDPHCFENDFDLQVFLDMVKFIRKVASTAPFSNYVEGTSVEAEHNPGAEFDTDEKLLEYIRTFVGTTFHTAGSLSMLPKEKNGVVNPELKVYGTANIRVADLSIVPLHFSGHSVATAYAIGGFAADIIKRSL